MTCQHSLDYTALPNIWWRIIISGTCKLCLILSLTWRIRYMNKPLAWKWQYIVVLVLKSDWLSCLPWILIWQFNNIETFLLYVYCMLLPDKLLDCILMVRVLHQVTSFRQLASLWMVHLNHSANCFVQKFWIVQKQDTGLFLWMNHWIIESMDLFKNTICEQNKCLTAYEIAHIRTLLYYSQI